MRKTSDVIRMLHRMPISHLAIICPMHKHADQFQPNKPSLSRSAHPQLNSHGRLYTSDSLEAQTKPCSYKV